MSVWKRAMDYLGLGPDDAYDESFALFATNPSAPFSLSGRFSAATFYNGRKRAYQLGGAGRVSARLNFSGPAQSVEASPPSPASEATTRPCATSASRRSAR